MAMRAEQAHLLLPQEGVGLAEMSFPKVDGSGCVRVRTNSYSAHLPADTPVQAKVYADRVEIWPERAAAVRHERYYCRISRSWNWSLAWTCWSASQALRHDQHR